MSFEEILKAARKLDKNALQVALRTGLIDEWKKGMSCFSAGSQLALENNDKAVKFLIEHGANIDYIARGAALGGHRDYAEHFREQGVNINVIAQGAVQSGYWDYVEYLREQGANINDIAYGAALGGHRDYAEYLREQGANIDYIAYGAAQGGYRDYLEHLRKQGANISKIAHGAAQGGYRDYAEYLRKQGANINDIAYGAVLGGHWDYAEYLREQGANIDYIARGAAQGGHRDYLEYLREQGANIDAIVRGATLSGYLNTVKRTFHFLVYLKNDTVRTPLIRAIIASYYVPDNVKHQIPRIKERIDETFHFKKYNRLSLSQAILMQQYQNDKYNFVSFWMLFAIPQLLNSSFPREIAMILTSYLLPLSHSQSIDLQFKLTYTDLQQSVKNYIPAPWKISVAQYIPASLKMFVEQYIPSSLKAYSLFTEPPYYDRATAFQKKISDQKNIDRKKLLALCQEERDDLDKAHDENSDAADQQDDYNNILDLACARLAP